MLVLRVRGGAGGDCLLSAYFAIAKNRLAVTLVRRVRSKCWLTKFLKICSSTRAQTERI
jgi:hypothetical protein